MDCTLGFQYELLGIPKTFLKRRIVHLQDVSAVTLCTDLEQLASNEVEDSQG